MDYLATHYKNLTEQLQSRINYLHQCLYEMDAAGGGGLNNPTQTPVEKITLPTSGNQSFGTSTTNNPFGHQEGDSWTNDGIKYRIRNGVIEFYWVGKTGEGWLPVNDQQLGN